MKIKNRLSKLISGFTAAVMCFTTLPSFRTIASESAVGEKNIVGSDTVICLGKSDGYIHEIWIENSKDTGSMTLGEDATFDTEWSTSGYSGSFFARRGLDAGSTKKATDYEYISVNYDVDLNMTEGENGCALLGVTGWLKAANTSDYYEPLVE